MKKTERLNLDQLQRAADLLKNGELVAFPTETVYGLGASIFNPEAVQSIYRVKGRPADNPLIAHVSDLSQISEIAEEIPVFFDKLVHAFFPGPLTVVLKRHPRVPSIISAGLDTIAIRMPSHPVAQRLIALVGAALVAPSANLSGKPSSTQADHVLEDFEGKIAAVIEGGKTEIGIESTVISLIHDQPTLLRPGSISKEEIERVLGCPIVTANRKDSSAASSPGMKYRHYCPQTPIKIFQSVEEIDAYLSVSDQHQPKMVLSKHPMEKLAVDHFILSAKDFYSLLRLADQKRYSEILILCDAEVQRESGLLNRLTRAAGYEAL